MFVLCALAGISKADQRLFLPNAIAPGQQSALNYAQRVPVQNAVYMQHGVASQQFGAMPVGEMPRVVPGTVDAPPQIPSTWALTGALLVGLSAYGVIRTATLGVSGQQTTRALPRLARSSPVSMGLEVGDKFPPSALSKCGVSGKNAVVFFYGADDAPSCSKEISAFEDTLGTFDDAGVSVVGVRNAKGVKESTNTPVKLVVDEGDEMREEIGIEKDLFGLLGGRETYVVDKSGTVVSVHNNQFDPNSHIKVAVDALDDLPKDTNPLEELLARFK